MYKVSMTDGAGSETRNLKPETLKPHTISVPRWRGTESVLHGFEGVG